MRIAGVFECCSASTPSPLRASCRLVVIAMVLAAISPLGLAFLATYQWPGKSHFGQTEWFKVIVVIVFIIPPQILGFLAWRSVKHLTSAAAAHNGELCVNCAFPLVPNVHSSLSSKESSDPHLLSQCPECGNDVRVNASTRWRKTLKALGVETV